MKKTNIFLLSSVLICSPLIFSANTYGQQCVISDCAYLGYTETSDKGGCLKCPFGDYWFCPAADREKCDSMYAFPCNRSNEYTPSGSYRGSCNGRYKRCGCRNNAEWSEGTLSCGCDTNSYKYTCTGTHVRPPEYDECDGKYSSCKCDDERYGWSKETETCSLKGDKQYYMTHIECFKSSLISAIGTASQERCSTCTSKTQSSTKMITMKQFNSGNDEQDMRDCINYVDSYTSQWFTYGSCLYDDSCK